MQTKLTLTIEKSVIELAKTYARNQGRSLSDLIENYLKAILEEDAPEYKISPSVKKLQGSIKLPDNFDYKKDLTDALSEKYGI